MIVLKDSSLKEVLDFLSKAEAAGKGIVTVIGPQVQLDPAEDAEEQMENRNVAYEALQLKMLFLTFKGL